MNNYDCSCWLKYPNEMKKRKNGKWKCVDDYVCVRNLQEPFKGGYNRKTHCMKGSNNVKISIAL